jgi:hypothetical protein
MHRSNSTRRPWPQEITSRSRRTRATSISSGRPRLTVAVASIEDLISMKRAAGRPKDLIEVEVLGALRDEVAQRAREPGA